jgi:transketolase
VGIACFGESAPGPVLMKHFGITADAVVAAVRASVTGDALVD